jgi:hypothetical protein
VFVSWYCNFAGCGRINFIILYSLYWERKKIRNVSEHPFSLSIKIRKIFLQDPCKTREITKPTWKHIYIKTTLMNCLTGFNTGDNTYHVKNGPCLQKKKKLFFFVCFFFKQSWKMWNAYKQTLLCYNTRQADCNLSYKTKHKLIHAQYATKQAYKEAML